MFINWIYFCVIAYSLNEMNAQICEKTEVSIRMVDVTYSKSYIETYNGNCYFKNCIKTRWTTSVAHIYTPKREWKTVKTCCFGYWSMDSDDSSKDSDIVCKPICTPCQNGYCKAPSECACNPGYVPDPTNDHNCLPSCEGGCNHGSCIAPATCQCDFGYTLMNATCQPVCTEPCHNGTCVAPETCECLLGYRISAKNTCEPYCSNGCEHGFCAEPETCRCNSGWQFKAAEGEKNGYCKPICSIPCANGICEAPDTCSCKGAYTKSKSGICEPVCRPACGNSTCIAPYTCSCLPGYHIGSDDIYSLLDSPNGTGCTPTCTHCKDANCVAPEMCYPDILSSKNAYNGSTHSEDASAQRFSWLQHHWVSIFIPLLVVVIAALVMMLVWRRTPIIIFFKGKSYVVEGDPVEINGSRPCEDIQITAINEKGNTAHK